MYSIAKNVNKPARGLQVSLVGRTCKQDENSELGAVPDRRVGVNAFLVLWSFGRFFSVSDQLNLSYIREAVGRHRESPCPSERELQYPQGNETENNTREEQKNVTHYHMDIKLSKLGLAPKTPATGECF